MEQRLNNINVRVSDEFKDELKAVARKQHLTLSSIVIIALNKYLEEMKGNER